MNENDVDWASLLKLFERMMRSQAILNRKPLVGELSMVIKNLTQSLTNITPGSSLYVRIESIRETCVRQLEAHFSGE